VAQQVERVVLIPVGATLVARDNAIKAAKQLASPAEAQRRLTRLEERVSAELRRFERRGSSARARLQHDVRRARARVGL
jgi:hypothetical protein